MLHDIHSPIGACLHVLSCAFVSPIATAGFRSDQLSASFLKGSGDVQASRASARGQNSIFGSGDLVPVESPQPNSLSVCLSFFLCHLLFLSILGSKSRERKAMSISPTHNNTHARARTVETRNIYIHQYLHVFCHTSHAECFTFCIIAIIQYILYIQYIHAHTYA